MYSMRISTNRRPTTNKTDWDPNKINNCKPNHNIKINKELSLLVHFHESSD